MRSRAVRYVGWIERNASTIVVASALAILAAGYHASLRAIEVVTVTSLACAIVIAAKYVTARRAADAVTAMAAAVREARWLLAVPIGGALALVLVPALVLRLGAGDRAFEV
jgi:hypothetical protein